MCCVNAQPHQLQKRDGGREIFTARGSLGSGVREASEHLEIEAHLLFLGRNIRLFLKRNLIVCTPSCRKTWNWHWGKREVYGKGKGSVLPLFENVWLFLCCSTCSQNPFAWLQLCLMGKTVALEQRAKLSHAKTLPERPENGLSVLVCPCWGTARVQNPAWIHPLRGEAPQS